MRKTLHKTIKSMVVERDTEQTKRKKAEHNRKKSEIEL